MNVISDASVVFTQDVLPFNHLYFRRSESSWQKIYDAAEYREDGMKNLKARI